MSKELLDNVYTIENAIRYLKGNKYIKEDSYSMEALNLIEQSLTPPTVYEVCKALSERVNEAPANLWNYKVYHDDGGFYYYNNEDYKIYLVRFEQIYKMITASVFLPPRLITLVGRFYEGVRK